MALVEAIYKTIEHYEIHSAVSPIYCYLFFKFVPNGMFVFPKIFDPFGLREPIVPPIYTQAARIPLVVGLGTHKRIDPGIDPWRSGIVLYHNGAPFGSLYQAGIHIPVLKSGI